MKLLEIAPDFLRGQVGTLLTILQHLEATLGQGDSGSMSATVPMSAVVNLMNNTGNHFSYGAFKQLYDAEPRIQEIVSNFNQNEITIGKSVEDMTGNQEVDADATVDAMAQKAAQDINQPVQ